MTMTKTEFQKWVRKESSVVTSKVGSGRYKYVISGNITILIDTKNGKVGIARCHPNDVADCHIGLAIAHCRLKNQPIPKVLQRISINKLHSNQKFIWDGHTYYYIGKDIRRDCYVAFNVQKNKYVGFITPCEVEIE